MKKIIILINIFGLTVGCDGSCDTYTRFIENNSGKDIVISSFRTSETSNSFSFSKEFSLKNQEKIGYNYTDCSGLPTQNINSFLKGDSIVIDFGDRIKSYSSYHVSVSDKTRNPYYLDGTNRSNDFVYTITPEDYANATPKP